MAVAVPGSLTSSFLLGSSRQSGVVEGAEVLRAHLALSPADCYPVRSVCVCVYFIVTSLCSLITKRDIVRTK